jgi:hypothetical protein
MKNLFKWLFRIPRYFNVTYFGRNKDGQTIYGMCSIKTNGKYINIKITAKGLEKDCDVKDAVIIQISEIGFFDHKQLWR